ncbi:hypothetical protein CAEBREN_17840 [Caenorhabditis brenneri]|uniref:NF-X1-type domain-containing protein n=1 Tax=Caenorhabditis brenneri TaxID=135651 RepID=G0NEA9_CAEBE|nr:hypothetical protein CAEBREN_17840 [Caenorhabditis brenneri]
MSLRRKYLDRLFVTGNWSVATANLLYELAMLYFNTARYRGGFMLTVNKFVPSWRDISTSFQKCSHPDLSEKGGVTDEELRNMDRLIGHIDKWIKKAQDAAKTAALRSPDISDDDEPSRPVVPHGGGGSLHSSDFRGSSVGSRSIQDQSLDARRRHDRDREDQRLREMREMEDYRRRQEDLREEEAFRGVRESPYTKDYRRYQEDSYRETQEDRRRFEEEQFRIQESRRRQDSYQEEPRRYQEDPRRYQDQYQDDSRRHQDSYQDDPYRRSQEEESRRRDEEYRRARDARRAESALGFRSGGGTSSNIQSTVVINDDEYPNIDISDSTIDAGEEEDRQNTSTSQAANDSHLPTHNCDEKPKQPYKYVEGYQDDYEPPWMRCEKIEPPEDFKEITAVPTMKDYVNPVEPYLRRIQELGVYKSAHHYLDVQFRLLREDLVSPMRDGMDIYRKNGTCKGIRKENVPCSDISIYNIERVDGKQVTERDGFEMRILWPAQYDIQNLLDNDREMKELGLVMLSGDRFQEDFHLGHIQTSLLTNKGCLHLAVHEETRAFEPNKTYQMAQATSYLPSYKHVLKNLQEISPFKPIPFERYLVHGRKEIFRPNFHRHPKTEDQLQEEIRLEKIYTDIRTNAASKRYMAGKPIPRGIDNDYECTMREEPDEEDLEYLQLKEPIFRSFVGVDTRGCDLIQIDHKWYKISRLLDDFHPTYLDESQRRAFCSTFKHELSLIQGPPGTGKTHIGVQIIKTMLQNRTHWKMTEPILVVCFTNSGLDNLLERIYEMIENDEELSRDNGKPRMIRYGRKCESDFLKRRRVMRFDVHDQYRNSVSDRAQRDQNKAGAHKRKVGADLVLSSYTLYCSRNDLLSYQILSRVMEPDHQTAIANFAYEHVDSKENPLNYDEAIACWLLDRDFGKATKQQTKKAKKNKFQEMQSMDSDEETTNPAFLTVQDSDDDEEDEDMDDEKRLDKLFNKMNVGCTGKDILGIVNGSSGDEYYSKGTWEIAHDHRPPEVVLMGKKTKTRALVVEGLPKQIADYRKACERLIAAQDQVDSEIMKMPMIIGATTTGCSRLRPILERVEPRILIVEEAAEVLEAHILSAMISSVEHCVMIGDHKQLRPNPAVHELGTEYGLQISMFERLVERALPYSQLQQQHRMNLNISDVIVKPAFYDNVVDAENVGLYPEVEGMATNLYFWSHSKPEESHDGISWMNRHEASMTVALVKHLLKQNYTHQDIVVLTTYSAQRQYFYREFPIMFGTSNDGSVIPVETVDSFQGRERKIAIVSLVRSHRGQQINTGIGFLAVANRICVALTRAQHGMYIVGNGAYIMNNSRLWKQIVDQLNRRSFIEYRIPLKCVAHNNIIWVKEPRDFAEESPEGGCLEICDIPKRCGHVCKRPCHPKIEYEHSLRCEYPCQATCPNTKYNHKCARLCYEDCGSCMRLVDVKLECGHTISTPCSRIQIAQCDQKCNKTLVCGHQCPLRCGVECADQCEELVTLQLDCSHQKQLKCSIVTTRELDLSCVERCENQMLTCQHQCKELCGKPCTLECQEIVSVVLPCGHSQDVICSSYEPNQLEKIECTSLVTKTLIPCGHKEKVPCHQHPSTDNCTGRCTKMLKTCGHMCSDRCGKCYLEQTHVCQHPCPKVLECGHNCPATCGEPCTSCRAYCQTTCVHQGCGASGSRTYGRNCSSLCILCTSHCANKCIHRSCTKKCYEECDVKTCSEPCTEKLKCGHACLGLCGEVCPKVCGSCQRQRYLQCVEGLSLSSQQVHRLIQVPKCLCIVPVEVLDEHVRRLKEIGKPLTCCKCKKARLTGILRYEKYMKKQVLDENLRKQQRRLGALHQSSIDAEVKETIMQCDNEIKHVTTNMTDENSLIIRTFRSHVGYLNTKFDEIKGKADQKYKMIFILEVARVFRAIAKLISMTSKQRVSSRKDIPPALDGIIQSIGSNPFIKVLDELRKVNETFKENGKTFMLGAVLQKMRMHTFKMAAYQMISGLMYTMSVHVKQNIPDVAARAILSSCVTILSADDKNDLTSQIGLLEQQVTQVAPRMKEPMSRSYWSWQQLKVPEL